MQAKAMQPALRLAGYCRISVDVEADRDNTSIENQKSIISDYVEKHFPGSELTFYVDRDRSGYTFEQRESYQQMRPRLMLGDYDILIVKDLSRFSRRNSRGLVELEDLRDAGVRIIAIGDSIDYPTHDDWTNIRLRFLLNEMPVTDSSQKVKSVIQRRQQDGKWVCSVPYGYVITNHKTMTYEVDEAAAAVVRKIFDLYNDGWGYKRIANYLTDQGIPTPRMTEKARIEADGTPCKLKARPEWSIITVSGILQNDFYIGTLRQGKYRRRGINGKDFKQKDDDHIVFEKHHEAIVDYRTFAYTQEQMKKHATSAYRGVGKYHNPYSGFLYCGDCGSPMFAMSRADLAPAYTCGSYHRRGRKGCTAHHTRMDLLDALLKKYILRIKQNSASMLETLDRAVAQERENIEQGETTLALLERQIEQVKEHRKLLTKQKLAELMRKPEQEEIINETYDELEAEDLAKLKSLRNQLELFADHRNNVIRVNRLARTALEIFDSILAKDRLDKKDLEFLIERITVYEDRIDIQLKADVDALLHASQSEAIEQAANGEKITYNPPAHSPVREKTVTVVSGGDPLEIYTDRDGEVILKKYSPIGEMSSFAKDYTESLFRSLGHIACIVDRDQVVAASGVSKKELWDKPISADLENAIQGRQTMTLNRTGGAKIVPVTNEEDMSGYTAQVVSPIIAAGAAIGAVLLLSREQGAKMGDTEVKVAETAAGIVGRQMEQ
ncbi:MAG: recombinase family protein [Clostridiales bacterium]|nr:recombinase family protein [Clostridiales bacterium]